jgi:hypothetical protein
MTTTNESTVSNELPTQKPDSLVAPVSSSDQLKGVDLFAARLYAKAAQDGRLTAFDEVRHLYETGNKEALEVYIDDLVYEALASDEEFTRNIALVRKIRSDGAIANEEAIRNRQNELFNEYKRDLVGLVGLPSEIGQDEYELAKERVARVVGDYLKSGGDKNDTLRSLGILSIDDEGREYFSYPQGLFPKETDKKWDLYLDRVRDDVRKERGMQAGTIGQDERELADKMRRLAHDAVTRDVHTILGFEATEGSSWNFGSTRNMLAKMRDAKYPTVETAEKDRTVNQVLHAANMLGVLGTKIADLHR